MAKFLDYPFGFAKAEQSEIEDNQRQRFRNRTEKTTGAFNPSTI